MDTEDRLNKYSERARKVLSLAEEEVRSFQHDAIGTEHLLLGLIREGEDVAARVLESLGITLEKTRKAVEAAKERGSGIAQGEIGITPHAEAALEMAMKEADRQHPQSDVPLLGTTAVPVDVAMQILQKAELPSWLAPLGVTLEKVRASLEEAQQHGDTMVQIIIETGIAPYASKDENDEHWHHPLARVDTEELLLGLLLVPECSAVQVLQGLGAPALKDFRSLLFLENHTTQQIYKQGYIQRFTRQARKVWDLTHEEVRRYRDSYISATHLLLGLVGEGSGVAANVLAEMGVGPETLREAVEKSWGRSNDEIVSGDIEPTPHLKTIIELSSNEARRLNHASIGTGHLLLALIREDEGLDAGLLKRLGIDLDTLRAAIRHAPAEETGEAGQEIDAATDASIAAIEQGLASREMDKTFLAVYPLTIEARFVLAIAQITAQSLAHHQVGPEHVLTGLAWQGESLVNNKIWEAIGVNRNEIHEAVERRLGRGTEPTPTVLVQSTLCRAYLLFAADEAERRDGPGAPIKSEHLLLGLLREEKGIIADLLNDFGTSVEIVRTKLLEAL